MTDRNVRDIVDRTISKIRMGMYEVLKKRQTEGGSLTLQQRDFVNTIDDEKAKGEDTAMADKSEKPKKPKKSKKTTNKTDGE